MKTILCYIAIAAIAISTCLILPAISAPAIITTITEEIILYTYFAAVATAMLIVWIKANKGE